MSSFYKPWFDSVYILKHPYKSYPPQKKKPSPFFLNFEIFNRNVHNYMVESKASSNAMYLLVWKKLNAHIKPSKVNIVQLGRTNVKVVWELNDVLIRLSSNHRVHQIIDIVIVDIPGTYGLFSSQYWIQHLKGYLETYLIHLWLPWKGEPNKIKVNRERYMKHVVTDINGFNEPIMLNDSFTVDSFFGNFAAKTSSFTNLK